MRDSDSPPSGGSPSSVGRARLGQTRTGGGTSAAGSSGFLGRGCSTYSTPGVFVPGYTHDILISPDLLFASSSHASPLLVLYYVPPLSLFLRVSLYLSLLAFLFPFSSTVYPSTLYRRLILSSCETNFSNQTDKFAKVAQPSS